MADPDSLADTVTRTGPRSAAPGEDDAQLRLVYPEPLSTTLPLGPSTLVLGRKPEAERSARLAHATVSRRHLAVEWDPATGGHVARDLGSHNGSSVDGTPIGAEPVALADGTVVRLGDVLLVYERSPGVAVQDPRNVSHRAVPGRAAATRRLRARISQAGPDPSPVLLVGETGTGKEYVARELHRLSGRKGPFVAINCAALSPQLVESQLFGHARGAFTGATQAHAGLFRAADGGTLLLDEVGELSVELQPKLLRVLQEREVLGVGETRPVRVDVRVVAATLRNLVTLAQRGDFRLDLYARLSLWEIEVPPLRQRRADLLEWVRLLGEQWLAERRSDAADPGAAARELPVLDADAAERLLLDDWPDNLRGIHRVVHRMGSEPGLATVGRAELERWLGPRDRSAEAPAPRSSAGAERPAAGAEGAAEPRPAKPSRDELARVLADNGGSIRATAKHFGRDRRQIYRWMQQYGLREQD